MNKWQQVIELQITYLKHPAVGLESAGVPSVSVWMTLRTRWRRWGPQPRRLQGPSSKLSSRTLCAILNLNGRFKYEQNWGIFELIYWEFFFLNYAIVFILCTVKIIKLSLVSYLHFFNAGKNLKWIDFWARSNIYRLHFPSGCCDRYLFECLRSLLGALIRFMRFLCSRRPKECANFIIGANGSGKSSILEAIVLGRFLARVLIFACYAEHLYRAHISFFLS